MIKMTERDKPFGENKTAESLFIEFHIISRELGGLVVESRTPGRENGGSIPTSAVLCPCAR